METVHLRLRGALSAILLLLLAAPALDAPVPSPEVALELPMRVWEGVSSWYGPGFHGNVTANGEIYNMYALTAAHRTLPLGAWVRLVNPDTGKAQVVRINDRGPYIQGREIDVSFEVARNLGFDVQGLARLQIQLLEVPESAWQTRHVAD